MGFNLAFKGLNKEYVMVWKSYLRTRMKMFLGRAFTECPRRNVPDFGRAFLMLKYTDITQNTYVQS